MRLGSFVALAIAGVLSSCRHAPPTAPEAPAQPIAPGAKTKWFSVSKEGRLATEPGVKVESLDSSTGRPGVILRANDGDVQTITCQCAPGCAAAAGGCEMKRTDTDMVTTVWCEGSCYSSENNPCGGCGLSESHGVPAASSANPDVRGPTER